MKLEDRHVADFVEVVNVRHPMAYYRLNAATGASPEGTSRYRIAGGARIAKRGAPIGIGNTVR